MGSFWNDLRYGLRTLRKSPSHAVMAVLSLALGIMATTAIYSVIYAVVLDPFPYKDVDNLMSVKVWSPNERGARLYYSVDQFLEIAERNTVFEGTIASTISDVLWTDGSEPQRLRGNFATPNTFDVMGIPALLGRTFTPAEMGADGAPVVVLGYKFWERQFGRDPQIVAKQLRLNEVTRTVIGVMPKRFMWRGADVYVPIVLHRGQVIEGVRFVHLLGRLKSGVTMAQAEVDLQPVIADLKKKEPDQFPERWRVGLLSFKETFPSAIRENLWVLFGAVGLLLLIACANVSNLLLAKASARRKEMLVRAALGARRSRIIRQLLTESLLIAVVGGVLGIVLAMASLPTILAMVPPFTIPDESEVRMSLPVLLFALLVSTMTVLIFGLAPALQTSIPDLASSLRESGRSLTGSRGQSLLRSSLVVGEIALALVLLVGAGLMIRTMLAIEKADYGFQSNRVLTMRIPLPEKRYPDRDRRLAFFQEVLPRISSLPGVEAVGLNLGLHPLGGMNAAVEVVGAAQTDARPTLIHHTNADYLKAMGITLKTGRVFTANEVDEKRQLAVVNESFVRLRFEGGEAVGRVIRVPRLKEPPFALGNDSFEVAGVVRDVANGNPTQATSAEVYVPYTLSGRAERMVILTRSDPSSLSKSVLNAIYSVDSQQPVTELKTIDRVLDEFVFAGPRFNVALFTIFAVLGLTLAVIGVYGVISSAVSQQTQEIGVRMALGARPSQILRMVMGKGALLLFVGIAIGVAVSYSATRFLKGYAWNLSAFESLDPWTFVGVTIVLTTVAMVACWIPARRATRVDPMVALRLD